MPTIILLDNSLSMYKNLPGDDNLTKKDLSHLIISHLIDHISNFDKFEYISLVKNLF